MLALKYQEKLLEVGTDEAGRGCLSGPVFAAAVILPNIFFHPLLNDSKQLSEKQRQILRPYIEEHAIAYAVSFKKKLTRLIFYKLLFWRCINRLIN